MSTTSAPDKPRKLSPLKWIAGVLCLLLVMFGCGGLGIFFSGGPPTAAPVPNALAGAIMFVLGAGIFLAGAALWGLTLLTGCFTFDFRKPFFRAYQVKIWILNVITGLLLQGGVAFMVMPLLYPLLLRFSLPGPVAMLAAIFAPFCAAQLVMVWLTVWGPLEPIVVRRRMRGRGLPDAQVAMGRIVGTSDPARNSLKKLGLVEEDFGVLWIADDRLVYWGDTAAWEIPHGKLLAVERKADAGSTSSYFGAVGVILRYLDTAGTQRSVRIHSEGDWTMTAKARGMDQIADRLNAWMQRPLAGWVDRPSGFAVAAVAQNSGGTP